MPCLITLLWSTACFLAGYSSGSIPAVRCCSSNSSRWHNQRPGATAAHTPMQRLLLLQPLHGLCCPDQHSRSHCAASRCRMLRGRTSWHGSSSCHCVPWCAGCCCPAAPLCWPCWYLVLTVGAEFWPARRRAADILRPESNLRVALPSRPAMPEHSWPQIMAVFGHMFVIQLRA